MKKIYPVTSNPWMDNELRYIELASERLSKPYLLQRSDEGRMSRKVKDEYRKHVRTVTRSVIAEVLYQLRVVAVLDVH